MTSMPTVSIIVPTYNRHDLLRQSLDSIFEQTYRPLEVVVVDDGSTDGTNDASAALVDRGRQGAVPVVWLRQENRGVSAARNRGLEASSGELVVFHDSDDLLDPDRIALQVEKLQATGSDLCAGGLVRFRTDGSIVSRYVPEVASPDRLSLIEVKKMHWGTPMFMYRRSAIERTRWNETLACAEDIDFNFRVLTRGVSVCLESLAVTRIREHADAVKLQNSSRAMDDYWKVHVRMAQHYRAQGMEDHLALEQATQLRSVVAVYAAGDRAQARRRFRECQPFASDVVSGGFGERLALQLKWCGLFCAIRRMNNRWGSRG